MRRAYDLVILGARRAGVSAAEAFRAHDRRSSLALINGEARLPYKRTSLSKHLASGFPADEFALHPLAWYAEREIDLVFGLVDEVEPERRADLVPITGS